MYSTLDKTHFAAYKNNVVAAYKNNVAYKTIPSVYPQAIINIFENKDVDNLKEFIELIARAPDHCEWIERIPRHYIELKDIYIAHQKEVSEMMTQIYKLNLLVHMYRPKSPTTKPTYEKIVTVNDDIITENKRLNIELSIANWKLKDIKKIINSGYSVNKLTTPSKMVRTTNF